LPATATTYRRRQRFTNSGIEMPRDVDCRTLRGRRFAALCDALVAELFGSVPLSVLDRSEIAQLANLMLAAEGAQQPNINGDAIDVDAVVRACSEQRRNFAALRSKAAARKPAEGTSALESYLASRAQPAVDEADADEAVEAS
jgi:hypothetical protein